MPSYGPPFFYPSRPTLVGACWRDHFAGGSLDTTRWASITAGGGSVTVTDSYAELDCGGVNGAAALYLKQKLDTTHSRLITAMVSVVSSGVSITPRSGGTARGANFGGTNTMSFTGPNVAGPNKCALVKIAMATSGGGNSIANGNVTWNGVAMNRVGTDATNGDVLTSIWQLVNPPDGAKTIAITAASNWGFLMAEACFYTNVHQTTPVDASNTNTATASSTLTNSITTATNFAYVADVVMSQSGTSPTNTSVKTQAGSNGTYSAGTGAAKTNTATAGATSIAWSGASSTWAGSVVALKPVAGTAGHTPAMLALCNGSSAPVADSKTNWDAKWLVRKLFAFQDVDCLLDNYFDSGGTAKYWDGEGGAATWGSLGGTTKSQRVREGDYVMLVLEMDARNAQWRTMAWVRSPDDANVYTQSQGFRLFSVSDWVSWSNTRSNADVWLVLGHPVNDDANQSHKLRVEWVKVAENNHPLDLWAATKDVPSGAGGNGQRIKHFWSYDGEMGVPEDRTTNAIGLGSAGQFDEGEVQNPWVVFDGVATDYMFYYGANGAFTATAIGVASAAHKFDGSPQNGPWTKLGSIFGQGTSGQNDDNGVGFPFAICDLFTSDPTKKWKVYYAALKASDSKWRTMYATSPVPDPGNWTKRATVLDVGAGGQNDELAARDPIGVFVFDHWEFYYEAWDANGVTHLMKATAWDLDGAFTKAGTYWSPPATSTDQDLAVNPLSEVPGKVWAVSSTSGFSVDAPVHLANSTDTNNYIVSRIRKIIDATTLELYHGVFSSGGSNTWRIKQFDSSPNMTPRDIWHAGAEWLWYINFWETYTHTSEQANYGGTLEEGWLLRHSGTYPSDVQPVIDYMAGPTVPRGTASGYNAYNSCENLSFLHPPFAPAGPAGRADPRQRTR